MNKKHHVKIHSWIGGILHTMENFFDSVEDAMLHAVEQTSNHANNSDAHSIKVYNSDGELVHHLSTLPAAINSYA
jgi:hypothetical protein